jgi:hypothetical protein
MIRSANILTLLLVVMVTAFSCTPRGVRILEAEAVGDFDLSQYQTYNFADAVQGREVAEVMPRYLEEMNIIKYEIANHLEQRGLRLSEAPDLLVNIGAVVEERVQTRERDIRESFNYIGQQRYRWDAGPVEVGRYHEGTVTIELIDQEENRMVWRGVGEGVIPQNRERRLDSIERGVAELFERVPYSE